MPLSSATQAEPQPLDEVPAEQAPTELDRPEPSEPAPLPLCATLLALLDATPDPREVILADAELDEAGFGQACAHWELVIEEELREGINETLEAFDEAYVQQIELLRGPIEPEDYAHIERASERGDLEATLEQLGLPSPGLMRIRRVCTRRVCSRPTARVRYFEALHR